MDKKKAVIAGLIIIAFILAILSVMFYIDTIRDQRISDAVDMESMTKEQIIQSIYERHAQTAPFYYFIPIFAFFGIAVGASVYYVLEAQVERKETIIKHNTEVILRLLDPQQRKVVNKIVEAGGTLQQVEITYMEGHTKVKAHRLVESLAQKGILQKEAMGKMRLLRLDPDLFALLRKDGK